MSLVSVIYLIELISNLGNLFCTLLIISVCITISLGFIFILSEGEFPTESFAKIFFKWVSITVVVSVIFNTLLPSKKSMYLMAAAYAGEMVVNSNAFDETYGKLRSILNNKLDEIIQENRSSRNK